ncbi:cellulase family glycosylhydrolase [Mesorhizobium sp. BAC0120]|uniref:glycoside hydrolase family 5 protein n=1 Tax=Mesorhizobium sp. BAC0120 TaxID=3090670 RepID=UPI00298D2AEF|nr:cellulase family glycosylhydrolase [Mesorhizobium sp. BAC0120]MDW6022415.1 cellulase family glycosylhydrolase [Mesorhizobium sp. BAC0120]
MRAATIAWALGLAITTAQAAPLTLHRGVGVHEWLNWSPINADGSYVWPPYRSEKEWLAGSRPLSDWPGGEEFARIESMGFDFVRLSVDPGPLVASHGKQRQEALEVLSNAVKRVTSSGLNVVFDLHGVSQVPAYSMALIQDGADTEGVARYREMVKDVAQMLVEVSTDKVALEPYNEPAYYPCNSGGSDDWQRIMAATVRDIRSVSNSLTIVATGACGGSIAGLVNLDPDFDDQNIYYSFHMYEPHSFTHQRSDKPNGFSSGLPWPASSGTPGSVAARLEARMDVAGLSPAEKRSNLAEARGVIDKYFQENWGQSQLDVSFQKVVGWAREHGIPSERLFMGEFGVILMSADGRMGAFDADRLRYISAVRRLAEQFHIPWSVWEFSNPYGMSVILPAGPALPDGELLKALALRRP